MTNTIRVGSRESRLAVIQSEILIQEIQRQYPEYPCTLITMKTTGDLILDKPLDQIGGKGLFIKELDKALLEDRIDLAVHSLKDIPMDVEAPLAIRVYSRREDPRDALVLPLGRTAPDLSKPLGCAGQRRRIQLKRLYPDWTMANIRGNVLTRLEKLDQGLYGGLVLAAAGLKRLGLAQRIHRIFEPEELLPAAGQGTLGIVTREDFDFLHTLDDPESRRCSLAERSFVKTLEGGCNTPLAVYGTVQGETLHLTGLYSPDEKAPFLRGTIAGSKEDPETLGKTLALRLLTQYYQEYGKGGKVWLVGAGPGDPDLLTLKARRVLQNAEVVLFDHLVGKGVLSQIPPAAELLYVGKQAQRHTMPQGMINRLLAKKASQGKRVVRLKGGDPFLFGRGGEELAWLQAAGIAFEMVPGISSALGVPAYSGIPVSHRDYCSQVHIITGHRRESPQDPIDYDSLVKTGGTLIFLMGIEALQAICTGLLRAGLDPQTPGAVIQQGTTAKQRKVIAPINRLSEEAEAARLKAPGIIIIGGVCALSDHLSWIESKPLIGIRIAVASPQRSGSRLLELLGEAGAESLAIPTIQTVPIPETPALEKLLGELTGQEWLIFTSPTGVEVFFDKLQAYHRDIRTLAGIRLGAVGKATAQVLEDRGLIPELVPCRFSGASLGRELRKAVHPGERVIFLRSRIGTEEALGPLLDGGIDLVDLPIYDTLPLDRYQDPTYRELLLEGLDWVAFTSASTVEGFARSFGADSMGGYKALCIGEQTARAAARYGMETHIAQNPTLEAMVETLKAAVT